MNILNCWLIILRTIQTLALYNLLLIIHVMGYFIHTNLIQWKKTFIFLYPTFKVTFPYFLYTYSTVFETRHGNTKLDWQSADIIHSDNFIGVINNIWPLFPSFGKWLICIIFINQYDWIKIRKVYLTIYCLMKLQLHVVYSVESCQYSISDTIVNNVRVSEWVMSTGCWSW